jgi:predicted ATPase
LFSQFIPSSYLQDTMTDKLAKIIKNKREGEILEVLRIVEPRLRDIQLVGQEIMADVGLSQRLPINVLGDGIRKILCIILAVYNCANGVLIIDEIDNGLHYSVMKNMWRAVIASAKVYNVQLFVSTHNLDLLKGLSGYLEETDSEGDRPLVSAYKLIRKADDEIVSLYYDYDNLSYSIQQEIEMR